jgi:hypothetical protein
VSLPRSFPNPSVSEHDVPMTGTKADPWRLRTPPGTLRNGYRGRFAMYVPPLLEELGLVELEHNPHNNRVRAL